MLELDKVLSVEDESEDGVRLELVLNVELDKLVDVESVLELSSSTELIPSNPLPLRKLTESSSVLNFKSAGTPSAPPRASISLSSSS